MAASAAVAAKAAANAHKSNDVSRDELPISRPMPEMSVWNSHPEVYLPIEAAGKAECPCCGADVVSLD